MSAGRIRWEIRYKYADPGVVYFATEAVARHELGRAREAGCLCKLVKITSHAPGTLAARELRRMAMLVEKGAIGEDPYTAAAFATCAIMLRGQADHMEAGRG